MRERVTFVHPSEDDFDEDQFIVQDDRLHVKDLVASREDQLTFSFQELPQEVLLALRQCQKLHIRWSAAGPDLQPSPFDSRVSPGLHIFLVPEVDKHLDLLCALLRKTFASDLKCASPQGAFSVVPALSGRSTSPKQYHFYQYLRSLSYFHDYVLHKLCGSETTGNCGRGLQLLTTADLLDIDVDSSLQTLVIKGRKSGPTGSSKWNEQFQGVGNSKIEVGLLTSQFSRELDKQSVKGLLVVLGEDQRPKPTLFSFPSRHHSMLLPNTFTFTPSFVEPIGLHPTLQLEFAQSLLPPRPETCALYAYLTLPSFIFADQYGLADPLVLASRNIRKVQAIYGETDLEAPDWAVTKWGSAMLVQLAPPKSVSSAGFWRAEVPLHLRYMTPAPGGSVPLELPAPVAFWACSADEGLKLSGNPFDRVNLGYDSLFPQQTVFHHIATSTNISHSLIEHLHLPVLDDIYAKWLDAGTGLTVLLGFLWILSKVVTSSEDARRASGSESKKGQ